MERAGTLPKCKCTGCSLPHSQYRRQRQRGQFYRYPEQQFGIFNLPNGVMLSLHAQKMMLCDVSSNSGAKISLRGCKMCPGCLVRGYVSRGCSLPGRRSLRRPLFSVVVLHSPKHNWLPPLSPLVYRLRANLELSQAPIKALSSTGSTLVDFPVLQSQLFLYETRR